MDSCFGCGKSVSGANEKKRRKPLASHAMQGVLETLTTLASKFPAIDSSKLHTGYACRACSDKLVTITSNLQSALPILPKVGSPVQVTVSSGSAPAPVSNTAKSVHCSQSKSPQMTVGK